MEERWGKDIDFRKLNREFEDIQRLIQTTKEFSHKHKKRILAREACCICGSVSYTPFVTVYGYNYVECSNCHSLYMKELPDIETLYTEEDSIQGGLYTDEKAFQKRVQQIALPKIEFVVNQVRMTRTIKKQSLLWCDIGCGGGEILLGVQQMYADIKAIGIESDPREIVFARKNGCIIIEGFLNPKDIEPQLKSILSEATIISMFNVLEHMECPDEVILNLSDTMQSGSFLIIEVPRHPSLASYANLTSDMYVYRHITPPIHLQILSDQGIDCLLKDKFKVIARWGFGQGFSDILLNSLLRTTDQYKLIARDIYEQLLFSANKVQPVIDQLGWADQMIYICMKI